MSALLSAPLSPIEARVLGVLIEKQHTVPDTYPLSLNALVAGCNQKSSRDPVMEAGDAEVAAAIDRLRQDTLVIESSGGRVARYAHNAQRVLQVPSEAVALLAVLMLRGAQTPGELRINCERLHRFADVSSVEAYLDELARRSAGALVAALPRLPGARETRWVHLLAGPVSVETSTSTPSPPSPEAAPDRWSALEARVAALEAEVVALQERLRGSPGSDGRE